jgi:hypothetical protein
VDDKEKADPIIKADPKFKLKSLEIAIVVKIVVTT